MSGAIESIKLCSFDGSTVETVAVMRPDRYRDFEKLDTGKPLIARGGGYSYAPASFAKGSISQDMTLFNRILDYDLEKMRIKVEAGLSLDKLLEVTLPDGLWPPVLPGYPAITVGGCIAANVNGKSSATKGCFREYVDEITLFHPDHGFITANRDTNTDIFNLTCGGYGLSGIIISATLKLEKIPPGNLIVKRTKISSFQSALEMLRSQDEDSSFAYSFHQASPLASGLGSGYVSQGSFMGNSGPQRLAIPSWRPITARSRGVLPFSLWGDRMTPIILAGHRFMESMAPGRQEMSIFQSTFPFAKRAEYFLLYGKSGLAESQSIIPPGQEESFLASMEKLILERSPSTTMASLKMVRGTGSLLRFEKEGLCVTLNMARDNTTVAFLAALHSLVIEHGGALNIIKDSTLDTETVRRCYPGYDNMKRQLAAHDPKGLFRSTISERLGLWDI